LKEWECVEVGHHKKIAQTIREKQVEGWSLNSYTAAKNPVAVSHYLLFEKERES
jgi:hypothetical protein